jgi:hypothetical protein
MREACGVRRERDLGTTGYINQEQKVESRIPLSGMPASICVHPCSAVVLSTKAVHLACGWCISWFEMSCIWTRPGAPRCISQTDHGSRGESWESHRYFAVYAWERHPPSPDLVI